MKTMLFNPYTGKPRDPRDISSDPSGALMTDPDEPLRASAPPSTDAKDSELIETLVRALKAARFPIASDCESFSTHRNVLAKIDAAIAAKEAGK